MKTSRLVLLWVLLCLLPFSACDSDDDDNDDSHPTDDDTVDDDDDNDNDNDNDNDDDNDDNDDTTPTNLLPPGIYEVTGSDSVYGDYEGRVEVRDAAEEPDFIRLVEYRDAGFIDPRLDVTYVVHSAWTGNLSSQEPAEVEVSLQVADFINQYLDLGRGPDDGQPVVLTGAITAGAPGVYTVAYQATAESLRTLTANETWTYLEAGTAEPIFVFDDRQVASHEPMPEMIHNLIFLFLSGYHALEFYDGYRDREDFNAAVHYVARHQTDFQWYRDHPGALRVVNKWLDDISLAETMLRARAFGPTLTEKAARFDVEMPTLNLNSLGMFSEALYGSDPLQQSESGDGLLWTGCYLASQVFRYQATGDPEALENWLFALDSLMLSHDIVQDDTSFARAVRLHVEEGTKEWIQGEAPYEDYDWLCCGNNDMIQGLYYGYTLSWIYLPEGGIYDEYRAAIAERAARLADFGAVANDGEFNEIKAHWLAWMTTGEEAYRVRYQELYANTLLRLYTGAGGGMFYIWGVSDWSGQHLDTIGQLILWFLAVETGDNEVSQLLQTGWINGLRMNAWTQTLWPIVAYALGAPPASLDWVYENAVWNMREIPYPKQRLSIDKRIDPAWCPSPLPSLFWKFNWFEGGRHQGLYGQPMWGRNMHANMMIPAPFDFEQGETNWTEGGGADFLHVYWLGRLFGLFTEAD